MKNLLRGFILGAISMWVLSAIISTAQTDEPLTIRVPPIATDSTWTQEQRADLTRQWGTVVTQLNMTNRTFAERMRKID